ncbi:flagellar basal-body rod protein FlgB [Thermincola ferriacetica]|uniref:Flagellar basal body rod protein FlgB n=2 Tax=Thermincola TaxID=278993 RepID=D5XFH7_THEPJ|nr:MULTISPECIES: flagellar basal body rod protein FlgB [Thermincola]ADG82398.1 flagellar basal-body rod protein FlgB [Thermincola potens JR]KNZ70891.1 flagellar basal-body rod protein FlgB [Thermincola ferriacetica]
MIEKLITSDTMGLLQRALDAASMRNEAIANNMANVDTPGYKRVDVAFEEELKKAMAANGRLQGLTSDPRHIPIGGKKPIEINPRFVRDTDTTMRNDDNNVDIDKETAALAKNQIMYEFLINGINGDFKKLRMAINGRG